MRWVPLLTVVGLLTVGVSGCDDREEAASTFAPALGTCHQKMAETRSPTDYTPVSCSARHESETFLVGRFNGSDADLDAPPGVDSEAMFGVYEACDNQALSFLGGDWRHSRLSIRALVPSEEKWSAGERWYRCDVSEMYALDSWGPTQRANSLKNSLAGQSPLYLTCFDKPVFEGDGLTTLLPLDCTGRHTIEFVGAWRATAASEGEEITDEKIMAGCWEMASFFAGAPASLLQDRLEVFYLIPEEPEWEAGSPGGLCFLEAEKNSLTRSLKGAGARGLPN